MLFTWHLRWMHRPQWSHLQSNTQAGLDRLDYRLFTLVSIMCVLKNDKRIKETHECHLAFSFVSWTSHGSHDARTPRASWLHRGLFLGNRDIYNENVYINIPMSHIKYSPRFARVLGKWWCSHDSQVTVSGLMKNRLNKQKTTLSSLNKTQKQRNKQTSK